MISKDVVNSFIGSFERKEHIPRLIDNYMNWKGMNSENIE